MKLQDDMHNSIKGYGTPQLDIEGYFGVDIGQEFGTGVCRNMADDIVHKLNAINSDYNARMFIVKAKPGDIDTPDIQTNTDGTISEKANKFDTTPILNIVYELQTITQNDDILNVLGDHAVVAVDLKKENITLIIDPTNICLGVFKDGKITIFNSLDKKQPYTIYRTPLDDFAYRGLQSLEVPSEYAKSFLNPFVSIDQLNEKYGVEAQQEALKSAKIKEENYIYQSSFKNTLKVDLENSKEDIYSIEEIKRLYNECMEKIYSINSSEEVIELCNLSKKIAYSINYYNQEQEKIVGKNIHYYGMISERLDLDMATLRKNIAKKMIETDAVILPENDSVKEFLCVAYLQAGKQEQMKDLKVMFDEKENSYYILNDDTLLATVNIECTESGDFSGASYTSNNTKTENEIKQLLENSSSIIQSSKQVENINSQVSTNNTISERCF